MRRDKRALGMELVEVKPVILGGDPVDPSNKAWVTRRQHIDLCRYWNRKIRQLRDERKSSG
jgi:hypothetical protein